MIGWLTVEVLKKAGPNLTRKSLIAAVEAGGYNNGPGLVPLLYSSTSHAGYAGVRLSKVTGTTQAYFGTAYTTTSGDDRFSRTTGDGVRPAGVPGRLRSSADDGPVVGPSSARPFTMAITTRRAATRASVAARGRHQPGLSGATAR